MMEAQLQIEHYWAGALRRAVIEGDVETGSVMAGQSVGMVKDEAPGRRHPRPADGRGRPRAGAALGMIGRRSFVAGGLGLTLLSREAFAFEGTESMYGLIGRMKAVAGQRDAVLAILLEGTGAMPGCLSYIVAKDPEDADALWVTEVWDNRDSHRASLQLPAVQAAIARARPLIAGFDNRHETEPVGGVGLVRG